MISCSPHASGYHVELEDTEEIWEWKRDLCESRRVAVVSFRDFFEGLAESETRGGRREG